jgi:hypothetical protein
MSTAERARWPAGVALLLLAALGLRLWGIRHGLPFVYNADENAHFVPRAIGMFGHSYNPGYFINPPAFTYLIHAALFVRYGDRDGVSDAFAADQGDIFVLARVLAALLGTAAVGFLVWAGVRFFGRRVALVAGALLAVAFLPVHYSHLALNDVPALAPLCLALVGVGGVLERGRLGYYALAGAGIGFACATKYTGGIVLLSLLAAAAVAPEQSWGRRGGGLVLAGGVALATFLIANPYALFDYSAFRDGLDQQSSTSNDGGGKLGLVGENGFAYYLGSTLWGLGIVPALAAVGGAVMLALRDWRRAVVLVPPVLVFVVFMGTQDRFFARWMLPVYPLICLLAAYAGVTAAEWALMRLPRLSRRTGPAWAAALAGVLLCAQGALFAVHNDLVLARKDTRQLAREWMVEHVPAGSKVVIEPVVPDAWATDPEGPSRATGNGARWRKWHTSRSRVENDGSIRKGEGRVVKLEDYERTLRPQLVGSYERGGYCWVLTGSTQQGRAVAEPDAVPSALRYYEALGRDGKVVFTALPTKDDRPLHAFSFDYSFNYYPLSYARPGPEIIVYRLSEENCA